MNTIDENILNVTLLAPRMKHPTIFDRFDQLSDGETLTILNDHDPKPLYYQLLGERGNIFTWEYVEKGPENWRIKISKKLAGDLDETLGQLAAQDLRKAQVFKKYGLDFCCGGKKTVKQACEEKGIEPEKVERELQQADKLSSSARPLPYNDWNLDFLADYIVQVHHTYVRKNLPDLRTYAQKVMKVHGSRHPELNLVYELVEAANTELTEHLLKEEQILFPYIKSLATAGASQKTTASFGSVRNPVMMMEKEHEMVGKYFDELRMVTGNYTLPSDACASYSLLYRLLAEFEEDLHLHIHLENNILFPKAIQLEKAV
ncbi:MAG: iron-sulfur cluster repair di-iron protein [Bacteroidetes bacterium]|nr:iron-sulfur cluster repair di-iron protein [Bacteroidota bacterium]MBS1540209.1 iron-sulfur cluster repair di-iron protein [Bacteroidota bacterium]